MGRAADGTSHDVADFFGVKPPNEDERKRWCTFDEGPFDYAADLRRARESIEFPRKLVRIVSTSGDTLGYEWHYDESFDPSRGRE